MSAQRYSDALARERMERRLCPECGESAAMHLDDIRFWISRRCDLLPDGVTDRIAQYESEVSA